MTRRNRAAWRSWQSSIVFMMSTRWSRVSRARVRNVFPDGLDDRRLMFLPVAKVRTGFVELGQDVAAPHDAIGGAADLEQSIVDELLVVDGAHARTPGECVRILEVSAFDRSANHDRFGFLRELGRDVEHGERQDLGAVTQLEPDRPVGRAGQDEQPEVAERKAASFHVVVLRAERPCGHRGHWRDNRGLPDPPCGPVPP